MSNIPALAFPGSDATSLCECVLRFRVHNERNQLTVLLEAQVALDGSDTPHDFVAQYDADDLVPGTLALSHAPLPLPLSETQRSRLARGASPKITTLSFSIAGRCTLWCPLCASIAPKPGHEDAFRQLDRLVNATDVTLIVDYGWLHPTLEAQFSQLNKAGHQLTGYPVENYLLARFRQADGSVFHPVAGHVATLPSFFLLSGHILGAW